MAALNRCLIALYASSWSAGSILESFRRTISGFGCVELSNHYSS